MKPARQQVWRLVVVVALIAFSALVAYQCALAASTDPEVTFTAPTMGATVSGNNVLVQVSYKSRTNLPIEHLEVYIDGEIQLGEDLKQPKVEGSEAFYWNTLGLSNSMHTLSAKVYDSANNLGVATISVYVSNTAQDLIPPTVQIYEPAPNSVVSGKVEIGVKASDNVGIKYVLVYVNDKLEFLKNYKPYTHIWDTTKLPNGNYTLVAEAFDQSENKATSSEVKVMVNNPGGQTVMPPSGAAPAPVTPAPAAPVAPAAPATPAAGGSQYAATPSLIAPSTATDVLTPAPVELPLPQVPLATQPDTGKPAAAAPALPAKALAPKDVVIAALAQPKPKALSTPLAPPDLKATASAKPISPDQIEVVAKTVTTAKTPKETIATAKQKGAAAAVVTPAKQAVNAKNADAVISAGSIKPSGKEGQVVVAVKPAVTPARPTAPKPALQHKAKAQPQAVTVGLARSHVVRRGETLTRIAARYNVSIRELARLNHLKNVNRIKAGTTLVIPPARHQVFFKGKAIAFDVDPVVSAPGISIAPFRQIFEHYGGVLFWFPKQKLVRGVAPDKQIELKIGSRKATVNDEELLMQVAAFIKEGRTMVPLRFVGEALDVTVQYDPSTGNIYLKANH